MLTSLHKDTLQTETDETLHSSVSLFKNWQYFKGMGNTMPKKICQEKSF